MLILKRLRLYRDNKSLLLLSILFIIVIAGGIYLALHPPMYTATDTIEDNTYETSITHYAEVQKSSMLFNQGERTVTPDRYFKVNHPELVLEFNPQVNGEPLKSNNVNTEYTASIVVQSSRGEEIFAKNPISEDSNILTINKNSVLVDIQEFEQYQNKLDEEVPRSSQTLLQINHTASVNTNDVVLNDTSKIFFVDDKTYKVTTETDSAERTETKTVQKPQPSQTIKIDGDYYHLSSIPVFLFGAMILSVILYLLYNRYVNDESLEETEYKYHFEKYNSWITKGRPYQDPSFGNMDNLVQVNTLKGLVDIAIDNKSRVVHSDRQDRFFVYDEYAVYSYVAPHVGENGFYIKPGEPVPDINAPGSQFKQSSNDRSKTDDIDDGPDDIGSAFDFDATDDTEDTGK